MIELTIPEAILDLIKGGEDPCQDCWESITYPGEWNVCEYHTGMFDGWILHKVLTRPT